MRKFNNIFIILIANLLLRTYAAVNEEEIIEHMSLTTDLKKKAKHVEPRILKGKKCSTEKYPFMVLIFELSESDGEWSQICGGSLINAYWVLTAAHCIRSRKTTYAVKYHLSYQTTKTILARIPFVHPFFHPVFLWNDIGLLRLVIPVTLSAHVAYVKLPTIDYKTDEPPCKISLVMGYGVTHTGKNAAITNLQCAEIPTISFQHCHDLYRKYHNISIEPKIICTLSSEGIDACQGDSGGPLLCSNVQYGIVSWSIGCGITTNPGIYTKVDRFLDFIRETQSKYDSAEHYDYDEYQYGKTALANHNHIIMYFFCYIFYFIA